MSTTTDDAARLEKVIICGEDENGDISRLKVATDGSLSLAARPGDDADNDVLVLEEGRFNYETVAASQTDQVLGGTGAIGDYLHKLVCVVSTAATAATSIKDGSGSAIAVLPNSPGGGVGTYVLELNMVSAAGAWKVTTGAGVSVIAIGRFSA